MKFFSNFFFETFGKEDPGSLLYSDSITRMLPDGFFKVGEEKCCIKRKSQILYSSSCKLFFKKWKKIPEGCFFRDLEDFGSDQLVWLLFLNGRIYFRKY